MPTATFYPSATSEPVAGEGAFINGVDPAVWVNPTTKISQDYAFTTDVGSLTSPDVNTLPADTPPTPTDARLASQFAYANIASSTLEAKTKMARGITLLRTSDNAAITSVIPATATAITSVVMGFRFADSSYGIDSIGGTGAALYTIEAQQRNNSGAIGDVAVYTSLYDYAGVSLYCYYIPGYPAFATLPTVAQVRAAGYGVNFRMTCSDVLESTPYIGINGLTVTIGWNEASGSSPRLFRKVRRLRAY